MNAGDHLVTIHADDEDAQEAHHLERGVAAFLLVLLVIHRVIEGDWPYPRTDAELRVAADHAIAAVVPPRSRILLHQELDAFARRPDHVAGLQRQVLVGL